MSVPTLFILDLKIITEIIALGLLCTTLIFFPLNDWMTNKWTTIITDWHLSSCKKQSCRSPISWNITNIFQACCFGYFGHAWRRLPKMIVLTLKPTTILIYKKKDQLHTFFFIEILHFLHFKESWNRIAQEHFGP